jgi:hypothetical protein
MKCDQIENLLSEHLYGKLPARTAAAVMGHLRSCEACRSAAKDAGELASLTKDARRIAPSTALSLRVRSAVSERLAEEQMRTSFDEILDADGLAAYLKVASRDIMDNLHRIPHFELSGKIRFKKSVVDEWLESLRNSSWKEPSGAGIVRKVG